MDEDAWEAGARMRCLGPLLADPLAGPWTPPRDRPARYVQRRHRQPRREEDSRAASALRQAGP